MGCFPSKNSKKSKKVGDDCQVSFRPAGRNGAAGNDFAGSGKSEEEYLAGRTSIENENVLLEGLANGKLSLMRDGPPEGDEAAAQSQPELKGSGTSKDPSIFPPFRLL